MQRRRYGFPLVALAAALIIAGCSHKLVGTNGVHTVKVYPDEATFEKIMSMQKQGGGMGFLGGLGENFMTKDVDENTPVRIISSDSEGAQIEVKAGPNKGLKGFVPRENLS